MRSTYFILLLLAPLLSDCARLRHKNPPVDPIETSGQEATLGDIHDKRLVYQNVIDTLASVQHGWIATSCDALLFSSLYGATKDPGDASFDVDQAKGKSPGLWLRRPLDEGLCYDSSKTGPQPSASSISKDMLLGLTYYAWRSKRVDIVKDIVSYGESHNWIMGEPSSEVGRVVLTPSLAGLVYQVLFKLSGIDHPGRHLPDVYPSGVTGYQAHLQVTSILLRGEVSDETGISDEMLARLKEHAFVNPKNPYYAAALAVYTGDTRRAVDLLSDPSEWPDVGLPDDHDHCQAWPIQRDDDDLAWQPCDDGQDDTIYGADFVWVADLLTRSRH